MGWVQARAQAARLAPYEVHVLVAQPHAQETPGPPRPLRQPRMMLDGEEVDITVVNSLLENASCVGASTALCHATFISLRTCHPVLSNFCDSGVRMHSSKNM